MSNESKVKIIQRNFFQSSSLVLSEKLLGKILVHEVDGIKLSGRIVEVEAYMGIEDKAAHSYGGRRTNRTEVMYGQAGILYVFSIYGLYYCVNIVASDINIPQAVLIRALEPIEGIEEMSKRRFNKKFEDLTKKQKQNLTNGPGKLCIAMGINKSDNEKDLCSDNFYLEDDNYVPSIVTSKRIGIDYAEEAVHYPWRFYIKDNEFVSIK